MPNTHPSRDRLNAFLGGHLEVVELEEIESHLASCATCCTQLTTLTSDDDFTNQVRRVVSGQMDHPLPSLPGVVVIEEIGRGGMGVVYRARHLALQRVVALKVLISGVHAGPEERHRFQAEAAALAQLRHPNIVQVFEAGAHNGLLYLIQEFVEGASLATVLGGQPQDPLASAKLVAVLAQAVEAAHQAGIIHRDLKPANVLMSMADERESGAPANRLEGRTPFIVDFGLAKSLHVGLDMTRTGALAGTPSYMAPEQATSNTPPRPTIDVYALGAILYECMTGRPPFQNATPFDTLRDVCQVDPIPPRQFRRQLPRDLEIICLRCLEKKPDRRYRSAAELGNELTRYIRGEPIWSRPAGCVERAWKWASRRPAIAGLLTALAVTIVIGCATTLYYFIQAQQRAKSAELARHHADLQSAELKLMAALDQCQSGNIQAGLWTMIDAWRTAPDNCTDFLHVVRMNIATWSRQLPILQWTCVGHLPESNRPAAPQIQFLDNDSHEFVVWRSRQRGMKIVTAATGLQRDGPISTIKSAFVAFHRDGRRAIIVDDAKKTGQLIDWASGRVLADGLSFVDRNSQPVGIEVRFGTPDQAAMLFSSDSEYGTIGLRRLSSFGSGQPGSWKLELQEGDSYRLLQDSTGQPIVAHFRTPIDGGTATLDFWNPQTDSKVPSPTLAVGQADSTVSWDGKQIMSISGDGSFAWNCERGNGSWRWWNVTTRQAIGETWQPGRLAFYSELARDGSTLMALGADGRVRLLEVATGWQIGGDLPISGANVSRLGLFPAIAPSGDQVVVSKSDNLICGWSFRNCQPQLTQAARSRVMPRNAASQGTGRAIISRDGSTMAVPRPNEIVVCRCDSMETAPIRIALARMHHLALSPDGQRLAAAMHASANAHADEVCTVHLSDVAQRERAPLTIRHPKLIHALAFDPTGKFLGVGGVAGVMIYDVATGTQIHHLREASCVESLMYHPTRPFMAIAFKAGWQGVGAGFRVWDIETGQPVTAFQRTSAEVTGTPILALNWTDAGLQVLDRFSCQAYVLSLSTSSNTADQLPLSKAHCLAFAPGGNQVVAALENGSVIQFDLTTRTIRTLKSTSLNPSLEFVYSPNARFVAGLDDEAAIRLWDAATGWPIGPPMLHSVGIAGLAFSPDSAVLFCMDIDGQLHRWPMSMAIANDIDRFRAWLEVSTGQGEAPMLHPLSDAELKLRRVQLHERWPIHDSALPTQLPLRDWHIRQLDRATVRANERAIRWHRERLARLPQ